MIERTILLTTISNMSVRLSEYIHCIKAVKDVKVGEKKNHKQDEI